MGARKKSAPRRGSLGYSPRKRASRLVPRVKSWPSIDIGEPVPLAFLGYKAGMTHVYMVDDDPNSPTRGSEVFTPVTIVEAPPMYVLAVRAYGYDPNRGLYTIGEAWTSPPPELEIERKIKRFNSGNPEASLSKIEGLIDRVMEVRLIASSQPKLVGGLGKKKPDVVEIKLGGVGDVSKLLDYAREKLGQLIPVTEVFRVGQLVDVIGVTKGRGFQGVVKRWGVKELPRWHKHRKGSRKIGARSHGRGTFWETPQAGQMGFHRRTEFNKRILEIGEDGYRVTPAGGFLHYGIVRSTYLMLEGSIPGTPKRPIVLRWPIRPPRGYDVAEARRPEITYVSLASKQGN